MALNIQGTFDTNEGLQVNGLFAFLFFSFDRNRTSVSVQYFKDLAAFNANKDYINVTLPKQFNLNINADEFLNGNVILMGHNEVKNAILAVNPDAIVDIVTDIAPPPPPPPVEPEVIEPEVINPEVVVDPNVVDPNVVEPEVIEPEVVVDPPADTVSDPAN